jgi:hypothetical protein
VHALIGLIALNACFVVWGYGLLAVLRRALSVADCGLAFCAGVGLLSTVASLIALAGHVPGAVLVGVLTGVIAIALALSLRGLQPRRPRLPSPDIQTLATALVGAVAVADSVLLLREAYIKSLVEWDAWAIWTVKAKALVSLGRLGAAVFAGAWPAYPPLVPLMQSLVFRFVGSFDSRVVHVEYALLLIAFAAALWRLLQERTTPLVGAIAALTVLVLPGLQKDGINALADLPLAIFTALGALFLAIWIVERRGSALALFTAFGAFAGWTKNEGTALVVAVGAVGVLACISRRPRSALLPLAATAAAVGATLPWRVWTHVHHVPLDVPLGQGLHPDYLRARLTVAHTVADDFWTRLGNTHLWFAAPYLLVLVSILLVFREQVRLAAFATAVPALAFVVFVWAYMIRNDPLGLQWLLETSAARTTSSIGLLATVLGFFALTTFFEAAPEGTR